MAENADEMSETKQKSDAKPKEKSGAKPKTPGKATKILVAVLGVGKGTWGHVARLISEENWVKICLISNEWVKENFTPSQECEWIMMNNRAGFEVIKDEIKGNLPEGKLAVSMISGSGKEHMALLVALRETKKDYELVILTGDGTKYY
ncbi:MAG: hypothetical protein ABH854_04675 [Candidatus Diapherotrites archaeon]|nr:hypothetical protein [Candidatus Micrarchaeota archaeon]MBU1939699.1 hypothetical protein [Candidatus Micrarchaeota archaeon]